MFNYVKRCNLDIKSKYDIMHTIVLIPTFCYVYPGEMEYEHTTVWACFDTPEIFKKALDLFTTQEIINFRDELDGNILWELAPLESAFDVFQLIYEKVGSNAFCEMLVSNNRVGICPLSRIRKTSMFAFLFDRTDVRSKINVNVFRQICSNAPDDIIRILMVLIGNTSISDVYFRENKDNRDGIMNLLISS